MSQVVLRCYRQWTDWLVRFFTFTSYSSLNVTQKRIRVINYRSSFSTFARLFSVEKSTSATPLAIVFDFWSTTFPSSESMMISPLQPPFDYIRSLSVQSHHIWAPPSLHHGQVTLLLSACSESNKANQLFHLLQSLFRAIGVGGRASHRNRKHTAIRHLYLPCWCTLYCNYRRNVMQKSL
jgi:hypothetical protein